MDVRALEETLCRIPGVEAVRLVMNGPVPAEVHVLALPGKAAKQVVRDVQSVALAAFGVQIDRRIVSVVQIEQGDLAAGDRPIVEDVAEHIDGSRMTVAVTLSWHEQHLVGRATGPAAATTRLRLVAEATLTALAQALHDEVAFAVAAVDTPLVGSRAVAIAQVVMVSEGAEKLMVGSALVGNDPSKATVRAVLDALNRLVPGLRRGTV
jgi:hypothetical protein